MRMLDAKSTLAVVCCAAVMLLLAVPARTVGAKQAGESAMLNGRVLSAQVRTINGQPYVPLGDVARALGMNMVKQGSRYTLIAAGGANQIAGRNAGKLGDELFTGEWRFKVSAVRTVPKYQSRYRADRATYEPKNAGDDLVVVDCRVKNGRRDKELIYLDTRFGTGIHTALTDAGGHSYEPLAYDAHNEYYGSAQYALPGAAVDFALLFSVPRGTDPKSLVFTLSRYDDRGDPKKHTDVRITLK